MKMKKIIITFVLLVVSLTSFAQQEALVSQYMFNRFLLNPALSGYNKVYTISGISRTQWVGLQGAPVTNGISAEGALMDGKMGVGLIVSNDRIGNTNQTDILANYSYHLILDNKDRLSFGARAGVSNYNNDLSSDLFWESNDNVIDNSKTSSYIPKFGFGAFYESEKNHYYAGLSVPTLLDYDKHNLYGLKRHFYLHGGYNYEISKQLQLQPSTLLKYAVSAPFQFDVNCKLIYDNMIAGGVSYRHGDAVVIMAEYYANKNLKIGYAFDATFSKIRKNTNGTHEIMVSYSFGKKGDSMPMFK